MSKHKSSSSEVTAIVLAAGLGTRMKSNKPKVLHAAAGRSLIGHVLMGLEGAGVNAVRLVVGHGAEQVKSHVLDVLKPKVEVDFLLQAQQLGTADAVKSAKPENINGAVLICNGDHPLISKSDYEATLQAFEESGADVLVVSSLVKNPLGFGRIVRNQKKEITGIVEEKDASPEEKKIHEVNTGQYVVKADVLKRLLPQIKNQNVKKEFYLTDLISLSLKNEYRVKVSCQPPRVGRGVNNLLELSQAGKALYLRKARELMEQGVTIVDPATTYIESTVQVGQGTTIHPGCFLVGQTVIGSDCVIEPYCQIKNSRVHDVVEIRWGTLIESSEVKWGALVGPYARLRPDSVVGKEAHVGNFVELKKTILGDRAKANHLTYLGDSEIGEETNIGCGTITCNYATDRKKYKTIIGKRVFVGSDTQFVAPINIGDDAVIGSGSTITKDVPPKALAIARGKQFVKLNYNNDEES